MSRASVDNVAVELSNGPSTPTSTSGDGYQSTRGNALSSKITTLLSSSFADSEIRDSLAILDARQTSNNAVTRQRLRQDAQKDVIDCNAEVIADFGKVAEV